MSQHERFAQYLAMVLGRDGSAKQLSGGIINDTFLCGDIIIQRLGSMFDPLVVADQEYILELLDMRGNLPFEIPKIKRFMEGLSAVIDSDGNIWRAYEYIEHSDLCENHAVKVENAAKALALLHNELAEIDYEPKFKIPGFHEYNQAIQELGLAVSNNPFWKMIKSHILFANRKVDSTIFNSKKQLIHGDPKLANWLFDEEGRVVGCIDWDTVMFGSVFIDIGDALRSWCKRSANSFSREIFDKAVDAYIHASTLVDIDKAKMVHATAALILELTARLLFDYAYGGKYFSLHDDPQENLHMIHCKIISYVEYYNDFLAQMSDFFGKSA